MSKMQLIKLFNSRLCHDLIGPAGSLNFSLDLLQEDSSLENKEAVDIAANSITTLINRLSFYRMALGAASLGEEKDVILGKAKALILDLFLEKEVSITWHVSVDKVLEKIADNDNMKLIMNIFLILFYAIPKIAVIEVFARSLEKSVGFAILVSGKGVKLGNDNLEALQLKINEEDLTPRTIQSYFTGLLAKQINSKVEITEKIDSELRIALDFLS